MKRQGPWRDPRMMGLPQHGAERKIWKWMPEQSATKTLPNRFLAANLGFVL